jgi:hypothetical protein
MQQFNRRKERKSEIIANIAMEDTRPNDVGRNFRI